MKNYINVLALVIAITLVVPFTNNVMAEQTKSNKSETRSHSDVLQEAKLVTLFAVNRNLSVFDIDTEVKNNVAVLNGAVETDIEKNLAEEIARSVEGIKDVNNNIVVSKAKSSEAKKRQQQANKGPTWGQKIEDMTTTASIKSKLLTNSNTHGLDVNIDTTSGKVTLKGKVKSDAEKALIEKIAENTNGVVAVTNKLEVNKNKSS